MSEDSGEALARDGVQARAIQPEEPQFQQTVVLENTTTSLSPLSGVVNDERLVSLWLDRFDSLNTRRAYARDLASFMSFTQKPLREVTYADVADWTDTLTGSASSRRRRICSVRSLFAFGMRIGYFQFNVTAPVRLPKITRSLASRILDETDVIRMLALEQNPRNRAFLHVLYYGALRLQEALALCWKDVIDREKGRLQLNVVGKGSKPRSVVLPPRASTELRVIEGAAEPETVVFAGRGSSPLSESQGRRIVSAAAKRARIRHNVSPHWLRHAHASHAHQRGCPLAVISETLGHASLSTTSTYVHARPDSSSALWLDGSSGGES